VLHASREAIVQTFGGANPCEASSLGVLEFPPSNSAKTRRL